MGSEIEYQPGVNVPRTKRGARPGWTSAISAAFMWRNSMPWRSRASQPGSEARHSASLSKTSRLPSRRSMGSVPDAARKGSSSALERSISAVCAAVAASTREGEQACATRSIQGAMRSA